MAKFYPKALFVALLFIVGTFSQSTFSQIKKEETFKRIKVSNINPLIIQKLQEAEIDLRCGISHQHQAMVFEVSPTELASLRKNNVPFTVEIEDLTKYYAETSARELPLARIQLEQDKAIGAAQKNFSIEDVVLDSQLQYAGCSEVNWVTPANYQLGSMGGCLTIGQVEAQLDLMRTLYPNLISVKANASPTNQLTFGNNTGTAAQRWSPQTVYYVRISDNPNSDEANEPEILYTSMIHSREVAALMSNMFFMWYLLENYNSDPAIKSLVDNNEFYFVPVVNPDGLRWNQTIAPSGGGMQRKNLRPNVADNGTTSTTNASRGIDLNRNFAYLWGPSYTGSSGTQSSDSYRGTAAFSEPESQIMRDFILSRNFETALWHHSFANGIPHPYGGLPTQASGRENEMHKWHEDMTRYNRYVSGATIFPAANGIADDWMLGGPADVNGNTGSGQQILATTPEHGHNNERNSASGFSGFWPTPTNITAIAKRAMRINLVTAYYGGRYARLHDLTQSNVTALSSNLTFGIERLGQTASNFTLTVTPVSANIVSITSPATQTGMTILQQRNVTASLVLNPTIQPNERIEYKVSLSNGFHTVYEVNFVKYYQPTVLFADNPDVDLLTNWTSSGTWTSSTASPWSGTRSIKDGAAIPYANNGNRTLTTATTYDLRNSEKILLQFYSKWDIERNFDFVELQGSTNGTTWLTLCGRYNKPETATVTNDAHGAKTSTSWAFQGNNSSGRVYDGDQMDKWVMEEIVIDATNNSFLVNAANARFRFVFRSDANNRPESYSTNYDGFYFDDFKIIQVNELVPSAPPTAVCQNITVTLDGNGQATITPSQIDNGSSDDVAIVNRTLDINSFDCTDIGTPVTVTLTVFDAEGQSDTCTATVTVQDTTAPAVPVIADATGECSVSVTAPTTTDNCSGTLTGTTTDPLTYSVQGTYTINWSFDDGNGNIANAAQTVIVDDTTAPAVPVIADATGECSVSVTAPTTTDNCSGTLTGTTTDPLSYTAQGTYTINWSFDDGNGNIANAAQTVIVDDTTAPVAVGQDYTLELDSFGNGTLLPVNVDAGSSDNCGIAGMNVTPSVFDTNDIGPNTVTLLVLDSAGNISSTTVTVTVIANTLGNENLEPLVLKIVPNPFRNTIKVIPGNRQFSTVTVRILDLHGRLIVTQKHDYKQEITINGLETLASGMYYVELRTDKNQLFTKKLIKD